MKYLTEWWTNPNKWRFPKVSIETFINDPYYLNIGEFTYPKVKEICSDITSASYVEGVEVAGIGSGKSYSAQILACYYTHHLLCLRNPHTFYKLAPDKDITVINMGINATQASNVVFAGISNMIQASRFFSELNPNVLASSIKFKSHKIYMMSGNSKSTTPLGYNIFMAVLDEAAFYMDNDDKSVAEEIYNGLQRRIVSRFGSDGLVMMISSPRYVGDFIMEKLEEAKTFPDKVYGIQLPTWKVKDTSVMDVDDKFYFNQRKNKVSDDKPDNVADDNIDFLKDRAFDADKEWWEIPGEFKKSFVSNPEKAKRDFGATPSMTLEGFFPHPEIVHTAFEYGIANPKNDKGQYDFAIEPLRTEYYIHIDLAKNKNGGDYGGFAMAHFDGFETNELTGERQKKVYVDLVERLEADPAIGEINYEKVREKIYALKALGFNIRLVTFDQYQSVDSAQLLKKKGIKSDLLSVDRTTEPYDTLKECIYEKRIKIHEQDKLREELCSLELIKGAKVDHPPKGSKDMADALCGAVYNVIKNASSGLGMAVGTHTPTPTEKDRAIQSQTDKENYYRRLESFRAKGLI